MTIAIIATALFLVSLAGFIRMTHGKPAGELDYKKTY